MDLSDGLATDLTRLCAASGVGATVRLDTLPIAAATRDVAAAVGGDALAWATGGGEDYELLVTCRADAFDRLAPGLTRVGTIEHGDAVRFVDGHGREVHVARGFEHFVTERGA